MAKLIISGGQSGADLAGAQGALQAGIPAIVRTFKGFRPVGKVAIPDGIPVEYLDIREDLTYGEKLVIRTAANVATADGTVVFIWRSLATSRGSLLTLNECVRQKRPVLTINLRAPVELNAFLLNTFFVKLPIVNIAGQRTCPEETVAALVAQALGGPLTPC